MIPKYVPKYYKCLLESETTSPDQTQRNHAEPHTLIEQNTLLHNRILQINRRKQKSQRNIKQITYEFINALKKEQINPKVEKIIQNYLLAILENITPDSHQQTKKHVQSHYEFQQSMEELFSRKNIEEFDEQDEQEEQEESEEQSVEIEDESPIQKMIPISNSRESVQMFERNSKIVQIDKNDKQNREFGGQNYSQIVSRRKIFKYENQ